MTDALIAGILFLTVLLVGLVGYVVINVRMWRELQGSQFPYPWNWRVITGPWLYFRWLDRVHPVD